MRTHTNSFKEEIAKNGRQIDGKIYYYLNYDLSTENDNTILTEDNIQLISEQADMNNKELIDSELIYSINIIKNGSLLQSLMKQLNVELKYDLKVGTLINAQFGVLVNDEYEYLNFGNYIIYSKEYNANNETWNYVCYDKMLYSMIQYKPLNLNYPCTIREYIKAVADRMGLIFKNANEDFTNYNQPVLKELFEGQNVTYRDILDKLSEVTASNILINDNDELELGYPSETSDTINEENLKDVNVNFGESFGPINKVVVTETDGNYEIPAEDTSSIEQNGLTQIDIIDNVFASNGYTEIIVQAILDKIKGLTYSINDFTTTGVCYYDYLDLFNVSIGEKSYKCLLLNNEINVSQGLSETIFTNKNENTSTETNNYKSSIMSSKDVSFKINQQEGKIQSKVEKNGIISAINQSLEEIKILAQKISLEGYTTINGAFSVDESGNVKIEIEDNAEELTDDGKLTIKNGTNENNITSVGMIATGSDEEYYNFSGLGQGALTVSKSKENIDSSYNGVTGSDVHIGTDFGSPYITFDVNTQENGEGYFAPLYIMNSYSRKKAIIHSPYGPYGGNVLFGYALYDNSNGSNGTITLEDSAANYDYLEIFYRTNDNVYNSIKVYSPNGKRVNLMAHWINLNTSRLYLKTKIISISGKSITNVNYSEIVLGPEETWFNEDNYIYITQVVGYK